MTATTSTRTSSRRAGSIALAVLQGLIVVAYLFSAYSKLSADPQAVAGFEMMGLGNVGLYGIGTIELLGALGLLIPRLMGLAATGLVLLMIGAVIATLVFVGGPLVAVPAVYLVLVSILAWGRRRSTAELVASLRR
ncbi:DoxX family protein [Pseudonocardia abyssalis]|jgi:uncharacterized membrane protein|uniref:DoxX family protein n=1 Tax=Pseudonocardia abyssalis TaxID=2792008 RepID=A0ABS6V060_9PSEU|nr:DoxX family protein [Pseudonocardia abyssalis]MBW0115863.1 DoxX family protein [Pseudonocardia abyssalis]MBW0137354.1 DoxX family protein [Pseudonocardia abyssalis]